MHTFTKTILVTTLGMLCNAAVAQQQVVRPAPVNLWMDVSTSSFAGMPDMESMGAGGGLLGGLLGAASGNAGMGGALENLWSGTYFFHDAKPCAGYCLFEQYQARH